VVLGSAFLTAFFTLNEFLREAQQLRSADLYVLAQSLLTGGLLLGARIMRMKSPPAGFLYRPHVLTADQEDALIAELDALDMQQIQMGTKPSQRTVAQFGYTYQYGKGGVKSAAPIPYFLQILLEDIAPLAGKSADDFDQVLINRYPPGTKISWHTDSPSFGPTILGVSLGGAATMALRHETRTGYRSYSQTIEPRSVYVLSDASRSTWEHRILPVKELRYSITFRSVKKKNDAGDSTPDAPKFPVDKETKPSRKRSRASLAST
jgi:alkylated DNA repair dioxygenase AlkB